MDRVVLGLRGLNRILFWIWDKINCHAMIEKEMMSKIDLEKLPIFVGPPINKMTKVMCDHFSVTKYLGKRSPLVSKRPTVGLLLTLFVLVSPFGLTSGSDNNSSQMPLRNVSYKL